MSENLECQLERRFRPLKRATKARHENPTLWWSSSICCYVVWRCSPQTTAMCFALRIALITFFQ